MAFYDKIFEGFRSGQGDEVIRTLWLKTLEDADKDARDKAQILLDWYNRKTDAILENLKELAKITFGDEIQEWQKPVINGVKRIIGRLSLSYASPPERVMTLNGEIVEDEDKQKEYYDSIYGEDGILKEIDLLQKFREMDAYSELLNTIHVEPVPRNGSIDWDIRLRSGSMVVEDPDNYLAYVKFAHEVSIIDPETLRPLYGWIYWTKDNHQFWASNSGEWTGIENKEGLNPYDGVIPVVIVRKFEQEDYWGDHGSDLVKAFQDVNVQLWNMWQDAIMQTHGMPFTVNCGFKPNQKVKTGPSHGVNVSDIQKDDVTPTFEFVKPDNDIVVIMNMIDWYLKTAGLTYGLSPSSWTMDQLPESGFAKFVDNWELLEIRELMQPMWIKVERKLLKNSIMVWNATFAGQDGKKAIDENLSVNVAFPAVKFPESPTEKQTNLALATSNGVSNAVRYFMENEGLDRNAAFSKAEILREEIAKLGKIGQELLSVPDVPEPGDKEGDEDE